MMGRNPISSSSQSTGAHDGSVQICRCDVVSSFLMLANMPDALISASRRCASVRTTKTASTRRSCFSRDRLSSSAPRRSGFLIVGRSATR